MSSPAPHVAPADPLTVAIYTHAHGVNVRVFRVPEQARAWRREIAAEWWRREVPRQPKPRPFDDAAADAYFEQVADRGESFDLQHAPLE